jgi:hypothetical protein
MLGREAEAQEAYREAIEVSHGAAPGSYAKALASLTQYSDKQVSDMEEAVRCIHLSSGERINFTLQQRQSMHSEA